MKKSSILFLILLISGCFDWYEVPTFSMEPTIMSGGKIKIEEDYYDTNRIQRFGIVGHIVPSNNLFQAKRIIGLRKL
ncbi:S26 family signal peptidase [Glaciecola sp. 1036]|uniref:S26 family signal peptidase n=1 Tax=Alteromonadaceae TaxID=72275 RepID=UPI003D007C78